MADSPGPIGFSGVIVRNLTRHPVRSTLTAFGVSLGVIAVVALSGVSDGFWEQTETALHMAGTDIMVFQANQAADIFSTLDEEETGTRLRAVRGVADVAPVLWSVQRANDNPFALVVGVRRDDFAFKAIKVQEGRLPATPVEVIIGRIAAKALKTGEGSKVTIGGREFSVSGVFAGSVVVMDAGIIMDLRVLQEMSGRPGQATSALVRVEERVPIPEVVKAIDTQCPDMVAVSEAAEYVKVDRGLVVMQTMVGVVSLIAVFIGGLVVLNTMWMSVYERTREIGILRALGWTRGRVVAMVLCESAAVSLVSGLIGSAAGYGLAHLATVTHITEQFVSPRFGPATFAEAALIALIIGMLGGLIPSWRASNFSPAEALRYE